MRPNKEARYRDPSPVRDRDAADERTSQSSLEPNAPRRTDLSGLRPTEQNAPRYIDQSEPRFVHPVFPRNTHISNPRPEQSPDRNADYTIHPRQGTRQSQARLTDNGYRFAQEVRAGEFKGCATFIFDNQEVLEEKDVDVRYMAEVVKALAIGDKKFAQSLVEKWVIVKAFKTITTTARRTAYFRDLISGNGKTFDIFKENCKTLTIACQKKLENKGKEETSGSLPEGRREREPSQIDRHTQGVVEDVNKMRISSYAGTGRGQPVDINAYNQRAAPEARQTGRHDPGATAPPPGPFPGSTRQEPAQYDSNRRLPTAGGQAAGDRHAAVGGVAPPQSTGGTPQQRPSITPSLDQLGTSPRHDSNADAASQFSLGRAPTIRGYLQQRTNAFVDKLDQLDKSYKKKSPPEAGKFFKVGRVFAILWHTEDTRPREDDVSENKWTITTKIGTKVFSHIRFFAVVKEGHGYCWAIPINTYDRKGLKRKGFNKQDLQAHAIIYSVGQSPYAITGEPTMHKQSIAVSPANDNCILDRASRINFAKVHTVEHNVTVKNIGMVTPESMPYFTLYWRQYRYEE